MLGIKQSIQDLFKSEFYKNILNLFSGMFIARIIPALFAIPIARIYRPNEFGLFVLYLTIASALSIVSTGKYESALILVKTSEERKKIFAIGQKINIIVNGSLLLALLLLNIATNIFPTNEVFLVLMVPLYAFFFSTIQLVRNIFISKKQFTRLAILEISRAVFTGALQCLFFILPQSGLFLGATISMGILYIFYCMKESEACLYKFKSLSPDETELAKRYINFPKYSVPSEVFNFLSSQLPVFLIKPFFGNNMLGQYAFSHRYISIPVQLLSKSISSVFLQKCKDLETKRTELSQLTFSLFKKQVVAGIIPFTILGLWGADIFVFAFGQEWEFSGQLAQIISPWLFAVMVGSPLSIILIAHEKQKISMIFNTTLLLARAASLLLGGIYFKDIALAVGLYSLTSVLFFVGLTGYSLTLANVNLKKAGLFLLKIILIVLPFIFIKLWL